MVRAGANVFGARVCRSHFDQSGKVELVEPNCVHGRRLDAHSGARVYDETLGIVDVVERERGSAKALECG